MSKAAYRRPWIALIGIAPMVSCMEDLSVGTGIYEIGDDPSDEEDGDEGEDFGGSQRDGGKRRDGGRGRDSGANDGDEDCVGGDCELPTGPCDPLECTGLTGTVCRAGVEHECLRGGDGVCRWRCNEVVLAPTADGGLIPPPPPPDAPSGSAGRSDPADTMSTDEPGSAGPVNESPAPNAPAPTDPGVTRVPDPNPPTVPPIPPVTDHPPATPRPTAGSTETAPTELTPQPPPVIPGPGMAPPAPPSITPTRPGIRGGGPSSTERGDDREAPTQPVTPSPVAPTSAPSAPATTALTPVDAGAPSDAGPAKTDPDASVVPSDADAGTD